ncbi:phosphoglycerate mutase family protein [Pyricularia oryzae]|uniref:Phosphoglycerate mutase family protein n=2 Tax=Pyricularia oryzae TaxID=318829 RepID=A0AA97PR38_PYRO3|nr:phosphoglycerate mutase family protein [Pyricularia oryzae Y34]KAI7914891.1 phosphoglycerate mutase family protein [Pyricularia oryzae]KAI7920751.1 phosphoglycerate mutase family protein [Pyricularia oryzae]
MNLLLIRHGESTDNVAGLLAGSRDAPLTAHGVIQARRLGQHLAERSAEIGPVVHVFTSDLQRALKTALEVVAAQNKQTRSGDSSTGFARGADPGNQDPGRRQQQQQQQDVEKLPLLREKDFGSREGVAYGKRRRDQDEPIRTEGDGLPLIKPETHEQMSDRMEKFVRDHLRPLLASRLTAEVGPRAETVVVVAHGIILNVLMRVLLAQFPDANSARPVDDLGSRDPLVRPAEFSIPWRNTAYTELKVALCALTQDTRSTSAISDKATASASLTMSVISVNNSRHLDGLKKTRGGIGSAQFDSKQKTMDSFFSRKLQGP